MNEKKKTQRNLNEYLTRPRRILKDFLNERPDEKFTVREIYETIGDSTFHMSSVYRNLLKLEQQGLVKRLPGHGRGGDYFQFISNKACQKFFHITCLKCGKTTHVREKVGIMMEKNFKQYEDFCLDKQHTTLVGICKDCKGGN